MKLDKTFKGNCIHKTWVIIGQADRDKTKMNLRPSLNVYKKRNEPGVCFTKVFRTELGHKYILVECSVIALFLPVMSKITRYKLVCYK